MINIFILCPSAVSDLEALVLAAAVGALLLLYPPVVFPSVHHVPTYLAAYEQPGLE